MFKNDDVSVLLEFRDSDYEFTTMMVITDEKKGHVDNYPVNSGLTINLVWTFQNGQISLLPANT